MPRFPRLTWVFAIVCGLCACNKTRTFSYADEGSLCVRSNADGTLDVQVVFPACLSSTCDTVLEASCSITVSDAEITLTSRGVYESPVYGSCSADCRSMGAECTSEEVVAPGGYTLVHGEDRGELTVPADGVGLFCDRGAFGYCEC